MALEINKRLNREFMSKKQSTMKPLYSAITPGTKIAICFKHDKNCACGEAHSERGNAFFDLIKRAQTVSVRKEEE